jgi:hypothetical protein
VPNLGDDPADWHYDLELDFAWLERQQIDVQDLMRPGSISLHNRAAGDPLRLITNVQPPLQPTALVSPAFVHVELMSWRPGQRFPTWTGSRSVEAPNGWDHAEPPVADRPGMVWPWDPRFPSNDTRDPLREGEYVRMVGALVADFPHGQAQAWDANGRRASNPSFWAEMHPPDLIERARPVARTESVACVAIFAANGLFSADSQQVDFDLTPPPEAKPDPLATVRWTEAIDSSQTNFRTIVEGNARRDGAAITVRGDKIHAHVKVRGQTRWGAPGKFKAIYRASWVPGPPQIRLALMPEPSAILAGATIPISVLAEDWQSGAKVPATIAMDDDPAGRPANTQFSYTLHGPRHRVIATAPGYADATLSFAITLRPLAVAATPHPVPLGVATSVMVTAVDAANGQSLALPVLIDDVEVGTSGTSFEHTFRRRPVRVRDPDTGEWKIQLVPPQGEVRDPSGDHPTTPIDFGLGGLGDSG